jgi:hypothetical protein
MPNDKQNKPIDEIEEGKQKEGKKQPKAKGMVEVDAQVLLDMQKQMKSLSEMNELLLSVADKKNLALYYQRNNKKLPKEIRIRVIDVPDENGDLAEKVVVGWRTIKDEVYKNPANNLWVEKQEVALVYNDGSTAIMSLKEFNRLYRHVVCKLVKVIRDEETGAEALELQRLDNGENFRIGVQYVN